MKIEKEITNHLVKQSDYDNMVDLLFLNICENVNNKKLEKRSNLYLDLVFKVLPATAFTVPFLGGGLWHLANRELKEQELQHKKRMAKMKHEFRDVLEEEDYE